MSSRRFGPYTVEISNEDKVLFPDDGITKGDVIDYHVAMAEVMLPHLRDRPLALSRHPDGIEAEGFYQRHVPAHVPDWIERARVETSEGAREVFVCGNAATLAYLGQLGTITIHAWPARTDRLHHPDRMILDLDPPGDDFEPVREAARRALALYAELDLPAYVMTTGSRGIHLVTPLDRSLDFDAVRAVARALAAALARRHEDELTVEQRKAKRGGRVYLDTSNNAHGQTSVAPYAVRARPGAPVACPLDPAELDDPDLTARRWTMASVRRRLAQREDPWRRIARHAVSLEAAREALEARET